MANQEYKQDTATTDNDPVSRLLAGLPKVGAPGDFEFRVKAGIASRRETGVRSSWSPVTAAVAVPMMLAILVGGYFGLSSLYSPTVDSGSSFAEVQAEEVRQPIAVPSQEIYARMVDQKPVNPEQAQVKPAETGISPQIANTEKRVTTPTRPEKLSGGGSFDVASSESRRILPRGFDAAQSPAADPKAVNTNTKISPQTIFSLMGIKASYTVSGWIVQSVAANNMADRSGIKVGDVIEAVNGQSVTENTMFGNNFLGKSVRVRRGGKIVQISLAR
ncbi:MAG: PDZ domain-containing protein [Pyrinomonadaceae bacterium]